MIIHSNSELLKYWTWSKKVQSKIFFRLIVFELRIANHSLHVTPTLVELDIWKFVIQLENNEYPSHFEEVLTRTKLVEGACCHGYRSETKMASKACSAVSSVSFTSDTHTLSM